ncbi:MAG TPA: hypothetical protein ENK99_03885 [Campylobacterales bacterium]|nr:hypothetical protein [Campylobacterales bacterium]
MRFILLLLLTINLFAIDAELTIEKDVESKASLSIIEDENSARSSALHQKMFALLLNDIKMSGHFNADTNYHQGSFDDVMI